MKPTDLALLKVFVDKAIPKVVDGLDGKDGPQGLSGPQGTTGDRGEQGLVGKDGKDAVDGLSGADGTNGTDGTDGTNGTDGPAGKVGKSGSAGKIGKSGAVGPEGPKGDDGNDGRGIKSISVNSEDMLVVTYDDGDMTIAGKVSITRESTLSGAVGLPLGSYGITGTSIGDSGELIIDGSFGKKFNTGIIPVNTDIDAINMATKLIWTQRLIAQVEQRRTV